jgi:hypothetical protein
MHPLCEWGETNEAMNSTHFHNIRFARRVLKFAAVTIGISTNQRIGSASGSRLARAAIRKVSDPARKEGPARSIAQDRVIQTVNHAL